MQGTLAQVGYGNALKNVLTDGVAGTDTLIGGLSNDTYYIDDVSDRVIELLGEGVDAIYTAMNFSLVDTAGTGANGGNLENS